MALASSNTHGSIIGFSWFAIVVVTTSMGDFRVVFGGYWERP